MFSYHRDTFRSTAAASVCYRHCSPLHATLTCTEMMNGLVVALVYLCFYCRLSLSWCLGEAVFNSSSVTVL